MHRDKLSSLLAKYSPKNSDELFYKKQMLEFLRACSDCFERSCKLGHFTASSWLLNYDQTKVLLMHHTKLDRWFQLGGHCDGDSDVLRVAIKEAQEESGIDDITPVSKEIFDIDIHLIPPIKDEHAHYHFDIRFLLKVNSDQPVKTNHESKAMEWFEADEKLFPTSSPSVIRMLNKWKTTDYLI